jgi:hypothetical protein
VNDPLPPEIEETDLQQLIYIRNASIFLRGALKLLPSIPVKQEGKRSVKPIILGVSYGRGRQVLGLIEVRLYATLLALRWIKRLAKQSRSR